MAKPFKRSISRTRAHPRGDRRRHGCTGQQRRAPCADPPRAARTPSSPSYGLDAAPPAAPPRTSSRRTRCRPTAFGGRYLVDRGASLWSLSPRGVLAFISNSHVGPDIEIELFMLAS